MWVTEMDAADKDSSSRLMPSRWLRRVLVSALVVVAIVGASCGVFSWRYPGLTADLLIELRAPRFSETVSHYSFLKYLLKYFGLFSFNPQTQKYDFRETISRLDPEADSFELGLLYHHTGDFEQAVSRITHAIQKHGETEQKLYWLGLSYLRLAEEQNCASHCLAGDSAGFCSLPLRQIHQDPNASKQAAQTFLRLLDSYDSSDRLYRWLLNFSHMTTGQFPEGVPPHYRLDNEFTRTFYGQTNTEMANRYSHLVFRERAAEFQINTYDAGKGVAVEDFDRDGFLDIITGGNHSELKFYRNQQGRGFVECGRQAGLAEISQVHIITAADFDNDGWMDLFVGRPFHHLALLRNTGDGVFENVTLASGLLPESFGPDDATYTWVSTWGDVNNDGFLDLLLAQFGQAFPGGRGLAARKFMPSALFINVPDERDNRRRRFKDCSTEYGLQDIFNDQILLGVAFGDYDRDGWLDLFVSSFVGERSVLLRNISGRKFERTDLIKSHRRGFTAAFVDINHDGRLDLFHGGFGWARNVTENVVYPNGSTRYGSAIYLQESSSVQFTERVDLFRNGMPIGTMGTSFGDLNNDGAYDFYLGTGDPESAFVLPNLMYIGKTSGRQCTGFMDNVSMLHGWGTVQKGHGIVFFDFDHDGDQDVYSSLGGMWSGDAWPNQFFVNESRLENSWVKIRLRGRQTNFYGVGATIRVQAVSAEGEPIVRYYEMNNKTGFGSAPYLAHVGLMDAVRIESVQVDWPTSRTKKEYPARLNELNVLDENGHAHEGPVQQR